jgi:hypothetical protein
MTDDGDTVPPTPAPTGPRAWLFRIAKITGGIALALTLAYFVVSSEAFVKQIALPKLSEALQVRVTAARASFRLFSGLTLRQIEVRAPGGEPILTAGELRVRYQWLSFLRGAIELDELAVVDPVINVHYAADGTSNLDVLQRALQEQQAKPSVRGSSTTLAALRNLAVQSGALSVTRVAPEGQRRVQSLRGFAFAIDRFEAGKNGVLTLNTAAQFERSGNNAGRSDTLTGKASARYEFALDNRLSLKTIKGTGRLDILQAHGQLTDLAASGIVLECELTPKELRMAHLRFERQGQSVGRIQARGPLDLARLEGRLSIESSELDRRMLNLVTLPGGWDATTTTLSLKGLLDLSQNGARLASDAKIIGSKVALARDGAATPPLEAELSYQVNLNLEERTALLRALRLQATQSGTEVLAGRLERPMNISWGAQLGGFKDSTFNAALTNLHFADWKAFLGHVAPTGTASGTLTVVCKDDGKQLAFTAQARAEQLTAVWQTNRLENASVDLHLQAEVENYRKLNVSAYSLEITRHEQSMLKAKGAFAYNPETSDIATQTTLEASIPAVLAYYRVPGLAAAQGTLKLSGLFSERNAVRKLAGNVLVTDFTGAYRHVAFDNYHANFDCQLDLKRDQIQVHRAYLATRQGFKPGGSLDCYGQFDRRQNSGQVTFKAVDVNEAGLAPFAPVFLGDTKLVSLSITAGGTAIHDPATASTFKGNCKFSDLVLAHPQKQLPTTPLTLSLDLDVSQRSNAVDVRTLVLSVPPTRRAKNLLTFKGALDLGTHPPPAQFTATSDGLDLTSYWDLAAGLRSPSASAPATPPGSALAQAPRPLPNATLDIRASKLFLREIAVSNLVAKVQSQNGVVSVNPCQLTLNGAPCTFSASFQPVQPASTPAPFDFRVTTERIPIGPIASSIAPENKGTVDGELTLNAEFRSAGASGSDLRRSLAGQASVMVTNANILLLGPRAAAVLVPVATLLGVPELTASPLNTLVAEATTGTGELRIRELHVSSPAFVARSQGAIRIADVLTNSPIQLPVQLALRRALAEKANLIPPGTPTNSAYVPLPQFLSIQGTVGAPNAKTDKLALSGMLLNALPSGKSTGKAGDLLKGIGNILGGQPSALKPGATTPAPPSKDPAKP